MDSRDDTDIGQEDDDEIFPLDTNPIIMEHGLYTRGQVLHVMGISKTTLSEWQKDGLVVCRRNTKRVFYLGRDLIAFIRCDPGAEDSPNVAPASRRQKGRKKDA